MLAALIPLLPSLALRLLGAWSDARKETVDAELKKRELESEERKAASLSGERVRLATATRLEQRTLAFLLGVGPALHSLFIYLGTTFAAPLGWVWLDWTRHIPAAPPPFDQYEAAIIGFYFGSITVLGAAEKIAGAVALRALSRSER